jgi:hypothetical protein
MKRIIGSAAALMLVATSAAAQLPSASASALGMGDNYTALARGFNATAWNPAGLGMSSNPLVSFGLMSIRGLGGLDPVSLADLKAQEGSKVSADIRSQWLDEIIAEGSEEGSGGTDVTWLSASVGRIGVQLSSRARAVANMGPGAAELILFGNAGRTGTPVDVSLNGSSFDVAITSTIAMAYGQPLIRTANHSLALGVTGKYTFGHLMFTGQDNGGEVRADPLAVELDFPMVVSDTVFVFDKLNNGNGWGLDVGLAYQGGAWAAGVTAKNVFTNFGWDESSLFYRPGEAVFNTDENESDFQPQPFSAAPQSLRDRVANMVGAPELAAGVAYQPNRRVAVSADYQHRFEESPLRDTNTHLGAGLELRPLMFLPIRVGGALLNDSGKLGSVGVGLEFGAVNFTVSAAQRSTDLGMDQMVMFTFSSLRWQ